MRPDVWTHLAFGRGYGSYEHTTYRVLDMEMLRQLIEVGVVGLTAYVMLMVLHRGDARAPDPKAKARNPAWPWPRRRPPCRFLVVSTLFDVMSFPHCPYILLWMAGLLAVVVTQPPADEPADEPAAASA